MSQRNDEAQVQVLVASATPEEGPHDSARRADIAEGFAEVLGASAVVTCRYDSTVRKVRQVKPDLVLLVGSCASDRCDYASLRKACDECDARLAFWMQNDPYEFDAHPKIVSLADFIFTNDRWAALHYPGSAVWHLPPAASARRFAQVTSLPWSDRSRDVYFYGTGYPNRHQLLSDVSATLKGLRTEICGREWNAESLSFCRNQEVAPAELPAQYAAARVVLNMGRTFSPVNDRYQLDPSTPGVRTFEAAMAGSCQLLFADSLEVLDYFDVGREILLFNDAGDFHDQLASLLADGERAAAIGEAARRRALNDHTYAARVRTLLECVGMHSPAQRFTGLRVAA
jgi:spore maturation protein CgeB